MKRNIVLGQYEYWNLGGDQFRVAAPPTQFAMATFVAKELLVSVELPSSEVVNFHSGAADCRLSSVVGIDLDDRAVLPILPR